MKKTKYVLLESVVLDHRLDGVPLYKTRIHLTIPEKTLEVSSK